MISITKPTEHPKTVIFEPF